MLFRVRKIVNTYILCTKKGVILRQNVRSKKWTVVKGSKSNGYLIMEIDGNKYLIHRVAAHIYGILDLHDELKIDHIDLNTSNNCISNLRPATVQQNSFNTKAKGCYWNKQHQKWQAYIYLNGKKFILATLKKKKMLIMRI